ncbi:AMP-binding protein [Paenibacillus pinisoli]|nr:AMP-binding protein [Paenibacillus pinisoli]
MTSLEVFYKRVLTQPDHIALCWNDKHYTYSELYKECVRAATILSSHVTKGSRICLHMHKSDRYLIMMYACIMTGIIYVPIDPKSPRERAHFIANDSQADLVFIDDKTKQYWVDPETAIPNVIDLYHFLNVDIPVADPAVYIQNNVEDDGLALILYTSGSTGQPKGVMLTHENLNVFILWALDYFSLTSEDRIALLSPFHFDLSLFDIFVGLGGGCTLFLVEEATSIMPEAIYRFLNINSITVIYTVPTAYLSLIKRSSVRESGLPELKHILSAGETLSPDVLLGLRKIAPGAIIYNMYGPLETNVITSHIVQPGEHLKSDIPIGHKWDRISGAKIFIVDENKKVIENPNTEGEIWVSGPSVSPGYLNLLDSNKKFDQSLDMNGQTYVCFATGDYGWWDEHDRLHFAGRKDFLIKTRGFRVELGEVERALLRFPEVVEAAVVAVPHSEYSHLLVAHIVFRDAGNKLELLRQYCQTQMLNYMNPKEIIVHDSLPRTSGGKVSRMDLKDISYQAIYDITKR